MTLEQQAELIYPMPLKPCPYKRKKIMWLREKWVNAQLSIGNSNVSAQANQS